MRPSRNANGNRIVLKISLPWMLDVKASIDRLSSVQPNSTLEHNWYTIFDAKQQIDNLYNQSIYSDYLRISREKAEKLKQHLDGLIPPGHNKDKVLDDTDVWVLKHHQGKFLDVFSSELSVLPAFLVTGKEGYDTTTLIEEGHKLFPRAILKKCPEAISDMSETGKALAFELATACGFHTFRVVEAVIKRYWDHVSGGNERPSLQTIGKYADELEKKKYGEQKVWESLKQLAKLHRNPLIHPEAILTVEEAISTLGIARSVIDAMLRSGMPDIPPTTGGAGQ